MLQLIIFGVPLVIVIIAALLMPWHAKRGAYKAARKIEKNRGQ
ncbi:hypothetical protein [Asticcacaulis taihuensis]|nr:hypothetical protein [Asticcacaulis taihuensis]